MAVCSVFILIPIFMTIPYAENNNSESIFKESQKATLAYTSHAPITISRNSDFVAQSWPGEGTSTNPFIISNLNITSPDTICVSIVNTTSYFTIQDCWFSSQESIWGSGIITLQNVIHGRIEDNEFEAGHIAISVTDSSSCNFVRNAIGTSLMGFLAYNLNNSEFSGNTQISESMGYPVHIEDSNNVNIRYNFFQDSVYEGIGLTSCIDCVLEDNILSGMDWHNGQYGFAIRDSKRCSSINNNITNFDTAMEITDGQKHTITENFINLCWGGVRVRGNETIISDNEITVSGFCVQLRESFGSVVHANQLTSTSIAIGIDVNGGENSNITNNIFNRHEYGIRIQGARNYIISENVFSNCYATISFEEMAYIGLEDGPPINCKIINNILDSGFSFSINDPSGMNHEISGNLINGREFAYFYGRDDLHLDGTQYGSIVLASCTDVSIQGGQLDELSIIFSSDCEISHVSLYNRTNGIYIRSSDQIIIGYSELVGNEVGIHVDESSFCHIVRTSIHHNGHGILLDSSPNSTIYDCDLYENDYGMVLIGAHQSHIESNQIYENIQGIYLLRTTESYIGNNEILDNQGAGLLLNRGSRFNRIVANSFGWNEVNAVCSGFDNVWDDGVKTGNKWSDLENAFIYVIDEDDIDRFPSSLGDVNTTTIHSSTTSDRNSTSVSGVVTPEIATVTGFTLLGFLAVAILLGQKRK